VQHGAAWAGTHDGACDGSLLDRSMSWWSGGCDHASLRCLRCSTPPAGAGRLKEHASAFRTLDGTAREEERKRGMMDVPSRSSADAVADAPLVQLSGESALG